jgi:HEAT repeat protein
MDKTLHKLIEALDHPLPANRREAIWRLGEKAAVEVVPRLRAIIIDKKEDPYVKSEAIRALRKIPGEAASQALLGAVEPSFPWSVRLQAVYGLAERRSDSSENRLEQLARQDKSSTVRQAATEALETLRRPRAAPYD